MTPDEINAKHGRPSWRCWHCGATDGLEWWNGLSVAVCRSAPDCAAVYGEFLSATVAAEVEREAYARAVYGG